MKSIETDTGLNEMNSNTMSQLSQSKMAELSPAELDNVSGGFWGWTWGQYLLQGQIMQSHYDTRWAARNVFGPYY